MWKFPFYIFIKILITTENPILSVSYSNFSNLMAEYFFVLSLNLIKAAEYL